MTGAVATSTVLLDGEGLTPYLGGAAVPVLVDTVTCVRIAQCGPVLILPSGPLVAINHVRAPVKGRRAALILNHEDRTGRIGG